MKNLTCEHSPIENESGTSLEYVPYYFVKDDEGNFLFQISYSSHHYVDGTTFESNPRRIEAQNKVKEIVKKVNAHDELLKALSACKSALKLCRDEDNCTGLNNFIEQAEQAIKKSTQ